MPLAGWGLRQGVRDRKPTGWEGSLGRAGSYSAPASGAFASRRLRAFARAASRGIVRNFASETLSGEPFLGVHDVWQVEAAQAWA